MPKKVYVVYRFEYQIIYFITEKNFNQTNFKNLRKY